MTKIEMVNRSVSVIHQLHALVSRKRLKIDAFVVFVDVGDDDGEGVGEAWDCTFWRCISSNLLSSSL